MDKFLQPGSDLAQLLPTVLTIALVLLAIFAVAYFTILSKRQQAGVWQFGSLILDKYKVPERITKIVSPNWIKEFKTIKTTDISEIGSRLLASDYHAKSFDINNVLFINEEELKKPDDGVFKKYLALKLLDNASTGKYILRLDEISTIKKADQLPEVQLAIFLRAFNKRYMTKYGRLALSYVDRQKVIAECLLVISRQIPEVIKNNGVWANPMTTVVTYTDKPHQRELVDKIVNDLSAHTMYAKFLKSLSSSDSRISELNAIVLSVVVATKWI